MERDILESEGGAGTGAAARGVCFRRRRRSGPACFPAAPDRIRIVRYAVFGIRKNQIRLEVTRDEARILRKIMLYFRNRTLENGLPTEDIDALIVKLYR